MIHRNPSRVAILQRVLPSYRVPLFDALADDLDGNVSVFAGDARREEMITGNIRPQQAQFRKGKNLHIFRGRFYICWQYGLLKWLRDWDPQALIMEANPRYLHSLAAIRWMHRHGRPVIGWGLGSPPAEGIFSALRTRLRRNFIRKFDAMITYSSQGAEEYKALGVSMDRIFVAPNAARPKPRHSIPERQEQFRAGQPAVVFVGRLQARKRIDVLIRACARLEGNLRPLLWIIGDGPQCSQLKTLAEAVYPLTEFHGAQHGQDLEKWLRLADLFVLPGTGGLAVQEAMAFGLPVIVGESDGTQSDLVCEDNGWLLADDRVETLSEAIQTALSDVRTLRKKGRTSFRIVSEEINLENMVSVFIKAINMAVEG